MTINITRSYLKDLVYQVNGAAIEVHKQYRSGSIGMCLSYMPKKRIENYGK